MPTATPLAEKVFYNKGSAYGEARTFTPPERPGALGGGFFSSGNGDASLSVNAYLVNLVWSSWGDATASATGTIEVVWDDTRSGKPIHGEEDAAMSLTVDHRVSCAGQLLYTASTVLLQPGEAMPRYFDRFANSSDPCTIHAASGYVGGQTERVLARCGGACEERTRRRVGDCVFDGLGAGHALSGCRMHWRSWGAATTVGTGIYRVPSQGQRDYGIKIQLTRRRWCNGTMMSYTREKATVYGGGIPPADGPPAFRKADEDKLLRQIDRPGIKRRVSLGRAPHESERGYRGCEP